VRTLVESLLIIFAAALIAAIETARPLRGARRAAC
jgi:hypothetical protein